MFPQQHTVQRQHFYIEISAKFLLELWGTTAKAVFSSPSVLIKQQSTKLIGILIFTVRVYGMPLTSCSRFGYGPQCSQERMRPET